MTVFIHPYQLDDTQYPIGFINSLDASKIDIVYLKRNEFPQEVVGSYANYLLNKNLIKNFKCFYSDVDCWLPGFNTHTNPYNEKLRFVLSKDHAASQNIVKELNLVDPGNKRNNLILCSQYMNYKMGHVPLLLKLWTRKKLKSLEYSRSEMTKENSFIIFNHIVDIQLEFTDNNLLPWQPWTYEDKDEQKRSKSIYNEMIQVEKQFLQIKDIKESTQWLQEYNPDWIEKFIVNKNTQK